MSTLNTIGKVLSAVNPAIGGVIGVINAIRGPGNEIPGTASVEAVQEAYDALNEQQQRIADAAAQRELAHLDLLREQVKANTEQARSSSLFVAGPRPAIMWVCAGALLYHFILVPTIEIIATLAVGHNVLLPDFDMAELMPILLGLLGLGGLRTYEKQAGVARSSLDD